MTRPRKEGRPPPTTRSPSTLRNLVKETEKAMAKLEKQRTKLEAQLLESASDHERLAALGVEFADVSAQLEAAEERWLELAAELEEAVAERR